MVGGSYALTILDLYSKPASSAMLSYVLERPELIKWVVFDSMFSWMGRIEETQREERISTDFSLVFNARARLVGKVSFPSAVYQLIQKIILDCSTVFQALCLAIGGPSRETLAPRELTIYSEARYQSAKCKHMGMNEKVWTVGGASWR